MIAKLACVAGGGALGACLRYLVSLWGFRLTGGAFPVGTLVANVAGCLLIGVGMAFFPPHGQLREEYRLALLVGFLGAFTTFSSYGWETMAMYRDGQRLLAVLYVLMNNVFGISAVFLGYQAARKLFVAH